MTVALRNSRISFEGARHLWFLPLFLGRIVVCLSAASPPQPSE